LVLGAIGLFPLRLSMKIGQAFARFSSKLLKRLDFVGHRNLSLVLPELSKERHAEILKGCFESLGRQLGFVSHFPRLTAEKVRELIDAEGLDFIRQAQSAGRGVIIFSAHFGGWEASHLAFPAYGFGWNVLVRRVDNAPLESFVERLRTHLGSHTIDKKASARTMLRLLQSGELLGIVADLNVQEHEGVFVDFFGIPASTTSGLARLALKTDSVVIPVFFVWQEEKQKYLLKIEPPVEIQKTGNGEEDIRALTQAATNVIEKMIRLFPEQWMWIHKRWNTRPSGEPNLYAKQLEAQNSKPKVQSPTGLESQT
jgi:KDO2-lipid IV(A) lauroyltransferase